MPAPTERDITFQQAYVADLERDITLRQQHLDKERRILTAMTKGRKSK